MKHIANTTRTRTVAVFLLLATSICGQAYCQGSRIFLRNLGGALLFHLPRNVPTVQTPTIRTSHISLATQQPTPQIASKVVTPPQVDTWTHPHAFVPLVQGPYKQDLDRMLRQQDLDRMLRRYLSYVQIPSQSTYPDDPATEWPMNEGQKKIAQHIYQEIKSLGGNVEVTLSPDYYVYAKVPANTRKRCPSVCFMAHMDVTPEVAADGLLIPQVIKDYQGGDIPLGTSGLMLSPDSATGAHLKDVIGHILVTSRGRTNTGADDKTGCAILVSMIEQILQDKSPHGDVYVMLTQNEDVGMAAYRVDLQLLGGTPDIFIDVDGGEPWQYSTSNFSAVGRTYKFVGNLRHPAFGGTNGYVDAHTALAYFIGQIPPEFNPMHSAGDQGYLQAYIIDDLGDGSYRVKFRIRYFAKEDSATYANCLNEAHRKTLDAFPGLRIVLEANYLQYENVAYSMSTHTIPVIERAAARTGLTMSPEVIRAGTTGAMMVARGLPGASCIYSAQNSEHTVYEWCSINELLQIRNLCVNIVKEVAKL